MNAFQFHKPVLIGDLVSFYATVTRVGRSSITVEVKVYAERMRNGTASCTHVTEATLTYVAIDENRKPRSVPPEDAGMSACSMGRRRNLPPSMSGTVKVRMRGW